MKKLLPILFLFFAFISNAQTVSITSSATGAICAGTSVTFTATPSGYTTPTYKWYKNNVVISGATSSTYSSSSLSNNDVLKVAVIEGSASVTTNGLVMNLDAGNASSYGGTGNIWTDLTGRGNNGTLASGITYNALNGGFFQFPNGSFGGIILPATSNDFNFTTGDFAVELWVNAYNNEGRLISLNTTSNHASTALTIFPVAWTGDPLYAGSLFTNGFTWSVWHQVVYTRNSSIVSLYVDGVLKSTATDASNLPSNGATTSNTLGAFSSASNYLSYSGKMSIARVYKAAGLTTTQVVSNYNSICSRYGLSPIGTTSNSITTTVTPGPTAPSITVVGDACINKTTLSTPSGLSSYTWYKDNVAISGATTTTYSPATSGDYKVAVSNGTCSTTSAGTTIYSCGVTANGKMRPTSSTTNLVSNEGGINFGTGVNELGSNFNTTGLTTTKGSITATNAVLGGVISATNAITSSIGLVYSTDANFGTYSSSTIQSNVSAGTYTSTISGLAPSTNYYAKSFIINSAGTTFGNVVSFTTSALFIAPSIVTSGLILNLDAANPDSYSGSGTTWKDLSGNNNNATLISGASFDATTGSIVTNGIDQYITVPIFNTSITNITMQTWVYINANTKGSFMSNGGNDGYSIGIGSTEMGVNGNTPIMLFQAIRYIDAAPITYPTGWHLVTMTMDASAVPSIYIDGTFGNSFPGSNPRTPVTSNFNLGAVPADGGKNYNGKFAAAYFYDRVLSASEITQNYNAVKARFGY